MGRRRVPWRFGLLSLGLAGLTVFLVQAVDRIREAAERTH